MTYNILGRQIEIVVVPDGDLSKMADQEHCLGLYQGDTIYLASSLTGEAKKRVLMHELVHVVFAVSGLTNLIDDKLEEAICDALESLVPYANI